MAESILKLKVDSTEYNAKLKRATEGLRAYADGCRKAAGTLEVVEKDTLDYVKAIGKMETVSKTSKGKLNELTQSFTELSAVYKKMSQAEKNGEMGKALSQSLDQLKVRIKDTKQELAEINQELNGNKFGQFGGIIDDLGRKMGVNVSITEMLTSETALMTGAITAGATAVAAATKAWADYNSELAKQQQIAAVTTGLKGEDNDQLVAAARSMSRIYGTDFREIINAVNTLMSQFGESGSDAIQLIRDGMQGMIQGDGPKLLSMIQQYAPAFRDAGVSASQLVAVIQNSEGGIFTDQNMQAIVMGIKNIRLMTKSTSDALGQLGINGEKMTQQLNDGTITVFDALRQVASELKNVDSNSQAAGQVMQQVFGRQGAMAGTNLAKAIESLNTNLDETKTQTGNVGESLAELNSETERLEANLIRIFGMDGWDVMANKIKTEVIFTLNYTLETLDNIYSTIDKIGNANGFTRLLSKVVEVVGPLGNVYSLLRNIMELAGVESTAGGVPAPNNNGNNGILSWKQQMAKRFKNYDPNGMGGVGKAADGNWYQYQNGKMVKLEEFSTTPTTPTRPKGGSKSTTDISSKIAFNVPEIDRSSTFQHVSPYEMMKTMFPTYTPIDNATITQGPLEKLNIEIDALTKAMEKAQTPEEYQNLKAGRDAKERERDKFRGDDKSFDKNIATMSKALSGLNSIKAGFEGMGIKLPEEMNKMLNVAQGLMSIIQGVETVISIFSTTSQTANTAALVSNTVAIASLEAAVWANTAASIIPFARGGIVPTFANGGLIGKAAGGMMIPGNSFSGDNLRLPVDGGRGMIGVNSGELILNKSQQSTLASQLEGGGFRDFQIVGILKGENVLLQIRRTLRKQGEDLVTWSNN